MWAVSEKLKALRQSGSLRLHVIDFVICSMSFITKTKHALGNEKQLISDFSERTLELCNDSIVLQFNLVHEMTKEFETSMRELIDFRDLLMVIDHEPLDLKHASMMIRKMQHCANFLNHLKTNLDESMQFFLFEERE